MTSEFAIAVHALVFMKHRQCCVSSEKIAENVCTNPARVRKVLAKLKKAALIETKEGIDGGCYFLERPAAVTLDRVCSAVGELPITVSKRTGDPNMDCLIASGMAGVMDGIYGEMNRHCMEYLAGITLADIDDRLFENKSSEEAHGSRKQFG